MNQSMKQVLTSKRGIVEALGTLMVVMTFLTAVGIGVAHYAINSKQATLLQNTRQAVLNRAELYASDLNEDLINPTAPSTARDCSTVTQMCTKVISATPSADGLKTVLRIQGDTVAALGSSVTQDVTIVRNDVTHVTAIDADGNNIWAKSDEGLRFTTWSVASGKPSDVSPEDLEGPTADNRWVAVDDRAGIDSKGSLWVWGKNDVGQAGVGSTSTTAVKPKRVSADGVQFRSVVTDDDRGYAVDASGFVWAWGKNDRGQLGLGADAASVVRTPTKVAGKRFVSVAIGKSNAFAVSTSGQLLAAGAAQTGLFAGSTSGWSVISPDTRFKTVAATTAGAVATIDMAGALSVTGSSYPFTPLAGGVFTQVSLGATTGYALGTNARIYSFGQDTTGQLGLGSTTSAATPTLTQMPKFVAVQGGKTAAFAIDVTGALYYTGKAPAGSYASGYLPQMSVFTKVAEGTRFSQIASNSGDLAAAFLDADGNIYGLGTPTPGLWPMTYSGSGQRPVRMPVPDGFSSYTWR